MLLYKSTNVSFMLTSHLSRLCLTSRPLDGGFLSSSLPDRLLLWCFGSIFRGLMHALIKVHGVYCSVILWRLLLLCCLLGTCIIRNPSSNKVASGRGSSGRSLHRFVVTIFRGLIHQSTSYLLWRHPVGCSLALSAGTYMSPCRVTP